MLITEHGDDIIAEINGESWYLSTGTGLILGDLQADVIERLDEDAWFSTAGILLLAENKRHLPQEITNALAKLGACLIVSTPRLVETERARLVRASAMVSIVEYPLVNRASSGSGFSAGEIAERALAALLDWAPIDEQWTALEFARLEEMGANEQGALLWELELRTHTHLASISI